jgi:uncharacterized RDD family membrane protein YckC
MPWFYANAGQQIGPIADAELERLAREGVIQATTLVWREGMQNWEEYAAVAPPPTALISEPNAALPPRQIVCRECGQSVPAEETVQIGSAVICPACKPAYVQKLREGAVVFTAKAPTSMRYAGFWIRAGAYLIDYLVQQILLTPLGLWFGWRMQRAMTPGAVNWNSLLTDLSLLSAIGFVLGILYSWLFVAHWAATPGKMLVRIKIVRADGSRVNYGLALGRALAEIVSSIPCGLGYLLPVFDEQKRALHDYMCNTRVVYK